VTWKVLLEGQAQFWALKRTDPVELKGIWTMTTDTALLLEV
jgi:hypothetical protein